MEENRDVELGFEEWDAFESSLGLRWRFRSDEERS